MPYLLNFVYLCLLAVASPWLVYRAFKHGKYVQGFRAKWLGDVPERSSQDRPCLWLHGVSVGEVNLLDVFIREWQRDHADWEIVISTTSRTGYELAQKKYGSKHTVFYCPLDFSWATRRAMRRIRPDWLVLAELELWPNLIRAAKEQGARTAVINARLSERSYGGYLRVRRLVAPTLSRLDLVAAQDQACADRFLALGALSQTVHITGSMKYDGAETDRSNAVTSRLRQLAGIEERDVVLLAGSTQDGEESAALEALQALSPAHPELRLILVPRHPERFEAVAELLRASGIRFQRRSELEKTPADAAARVLLVDTIGELKGWWGTASIAFVGGSFGSRGGQNMIEPAAYGAAVSFGPNTRNFRDIVAAMLDASAAVVVSDAAEMTAFVRRCLEEPGYAKGLGSRAIDLVRRQLGATARTVKLFEAIEQAKLDQKTSRRAA